MIIARTPRTSSAAVAVIVAAVLGAASVALGQAPVQSVRGASAERECLFMEGTAIPKLAMGVCRPGDSPEERAEGELRLWATTSPAEGDDPAAIRPLYVPLYVYEERPGVGTTWYRLGDAYASPAEGAAKGPGPLGWVDGRRLHLLDCRYAYHFNNPQRVKPGVRLYESKAAAYAALEAEQRTPPGDGPAADVLVAERLEEKAWDPLASGAVPPFVELRDVADGAAAPDTTLTFPLPAENRLVCLGAVGGGIVDRKKLAALEKQAGDRAGIEIVFVIDETRSMKTWFGPVADFISENLAIDGTSTNVKIAVSWYSDDTDKKLPYDPGELRELVGAAAKEEDVKKVKDGIVDKEGIVEKVRSHPERIVDGDATPRELVFLGLEAAIKAAGFARNEGDRGASKMVFVIGDAADRLPTGELDTVMDRVRQLILDLDLQVAFIQVGDPKSADPGFVSQAKALRDKLPPEKQDAVLIEGVNDNKGNQSLKIRIADIQARMEAKRQQVLRDIARLEMRNCYAQPGPAMQRRIEDDGLTLRQFDDQNLQYFMPAYGWLHSARQAEAKPQLRELVFLSKPEAEAVKAAVLNVIAQVKKGGKVDGDATVRLLAGALARNSGHSQVEGVLVSAWEKMPSDDRTLGAFLRDVMGLRVRNAVLYHRGPMKPSKATTRAVALLSEHAERLGGVSRNAAPRAGLPPPVWCDSWQVVP
ncbi:MAG: hypothetical protein ACKOZU_07155 [Planctomycetaceae bacterium]